MSYIGYNYKIKFDETITDHYNYLLNCFKKVKEDRWNAIQIYYGDKRKTTLRYKYKLTPDEILNLKRYLNENNLLLVIHSILTLNFCNPPDSMKFRWGLDNLIFDLLQCIKMGGFGVVLHLGRIKTTIINISLEEGITNYVQSLIYVIDEIKKGTNKLFKIIIETNNRQKNTIGGTIEEIAELYHAIPQKYCKYIFFCIDMQHIFSGGYNIRNLQVAKDYFISFERLIGKNKIKLIHLDDSKTEFNSHIDRHAPLEEGYIFNKRRDGNPNALSLLLNIFIKKRYNIIIETDCDHKREKRLIERYIGKSVIGGGSKVTKEYIISIFRELQNYYETMGRRANKSYVFKASSYERAIHSLNRINNSEINTINNVKNLNGFGKSMLLKITEILETGTLSSYEKILKDKTYQAVKLFNKIYGVGPEKAFELVSMNIYTLDKLIMEISKNPDLLNEKQKIGLKYYDQMNERIPREEITYFTNYFQKMDKSVKVYNAGSYYMGKPTSGDIDLILVNERGLNRSIRDFQDLLSKKNNMISVLSMGKNKTTSLIKYGYKGKERIRQLDMVLIGKDEYPWYILYFGSGRDFSKKIRGIASNKGYRLNEKGLFNKKTGERIDFSPKCEKDIFDFLEIPFIKPELR